ncbi:MAG: hypothetical protein WED04_07370 [Promethearchaeati archaeon SRVP18_Atabeyarchaeia-1]
MPPRGYLANFNLQAQQRCAYPQPSKVGQFKMKSAEEFYAANRSKWHAWLQKNHKAKTEVWLVF